MMWGARKSGYTPGKGGSVIKPSAQFVDHCRNCEGKYPAKKIPEEKAGPKKKDTQKKCHHCKGTTNDCLVGCRHYLCSKPPYKRMDRAGKKYPEQFNVIVPKLEPDGSIKRDKITTSSLRSSLGR